MNNMKFRVWHKRRKKYYKILSVSFEDIDDIHDSDGVTMVSCKGYCVIYEKNVCIQIKPKDCIIESYIGRCDKYKVDLYENDVCKYLDENGLKQTGLIVWNDTTLSYYLQAFGGDDEGNQDIELHIDNVVERIGDIRQYQIK